MFFITGGCFVRLCWNDWFRGPIRDLTIEEGKRIRDLGVRVAGINSGHVEASDADIDNVRRIMDECGLVPGPYGVGRALIHPDPATLKKFKDEIASALRIAGKLGCTNIRISAGSLDPDNIWKHHPENHTQKAMDVLVKHTRELAVVAEEAQCAICPETTQGTVVGSIPRMKEYVDRCESPFVQIVFDPVNHMGAHRIYESGRFIRCAIATLGDRIGEIHVKDAEVKDPFMFYFGEAPMGEGTLDHVALLESSRQLESWKTLSLEHIGYDYTNPEHFKKNKYAIDYIKGVAEKIGYEFTDPECTRKRWEQGLCK